MNSFITLMSFTLPHEAHLAKISLEAEGIHVELKDELTTQVYNFYSDAIGGVKIQVLKSDFQKAKEILELAGYFPKVKPSSKSLFDRFSEGLPLIGKASLEIRLISFFAFFLVILVILLMVYLSA